ncbi:MAG: M20/M25/M40 family metallo-hydrolase, partial [Myxococcota bacterium]
MRHRLDQLFDWLKLDSTTGQEAAYLERLEADLTQEGLTCQRQPVAPGRWNLLASVDLQPPEVVLCTHVDTVPPYIAPTRHPDRIHGRGACDTKGVLAAMVEAWSQLSSAEAARVGLLLVVGEEVDHIGAREAERSVPWRPRRILLGEPTLCRVALAQKGGVSLRLTS